MLLLNDTYMRKLGYLEFAAANNLILLFPQNNDTSPDLFLPYCWASSIKSNSDHPQIVAIG